MEWSKEKKHIWNGARKRNNIYGMEQGKKHIWNGARKRKNIYGMEQGKKHIWDGARKKNIYEMEQGKKHIWNGAKKRNNIYIEWSKEIFFAYVSHYYTRGGMVVVILTPLSDLIDFQAVNTWGKLFLSQRLFIFDLHALVLSQLTTCLPTLLISDHILISDAQCVETYEKTIFRLLRFLLFL